MWWVLVLTVGHAGEFRLIGHPLRKPRPVLIHYPGSELPNWMPGEASAFALLCLGPSHTLTLAQVSVGPCSSTYILR